MTASLIFCCLVVGFFSLTSFRYQFQMHGYVQLMLVKRPGGTYLSLELSYRSRTNLSPHFDFDSNERKTLAICANPNPSAVSSGNAMRIYVSKNRFQMKQVLNFFRQY
ncbi:hypothetical protein CEXT_761731 [Caerostris extrusa]|uniref:Secreted protein n=1 Tax=Caerostris extrusa TaxID=172846 RepID=A0AAV4PHY1_CAEEX|nr:hypothetical protein CEXT_761731 [Caerostris extrusa]